MKAIALAAAALIASPSLALADRVVLANNDTLTGTISSVSKTEVTVETELAGRVVIKRSAIARVTSSGPAGPAAAVDLDALEARMEANAGPTWHGDVNAGVQVSRGNAETANVATNGAFIRLGKRDRFSAFGTYLFASSGSGVDAITTARATRGGMRYDHDLLGPLFGFGFGDAENDPLQLLDLRTVVGGGAGAHLLKKDTTQVNVFAGVSYANDSYTDVSSTTTSSTTTSTTTPITSAITTAGLATTSNSGGVHTSANGPPITPPGQAKKPTPTRGGTPPAVVRTSLSRQVGEFLVGEDLNHQLSDNVSLSESLTMFPAMNNFEDYRIAFDLSLSAQVNGWLQWNVTVADRYLNIPPSGGAIQNDTYVSTGLGITFGGGAGGAYNGTDTRPPSRH